MEQETEIVEQFTYADIKAKSDSCNRSEIIGLKLEYENIVEGSVDFMIAHKRYRSAAGYPNISAKYDYKEGKMTLIPNRSGFFIDMTVLDVKYSIKY